MTKLSNIIEGKAVAVIPKKGRPEVRREGYTWERMGAGFQVLLPDGDFLELKLESGNWVLGARLNEKNYKGTRPDIETAFKVLDRLLWINRRELWSKIRCSIVLNEFQGIMPDD